MASSIEGYTLCWNDYANNLSISLRDLLQQQKLVDVTLVADGHLFSAHRLVLSALSPYFQQMFAQMPTNQQAFVFLKDVPKETLDDLITFIYSGQVNVKQEHLEEFFNIAKALNIKGLADGGYANSSNTKSPISNSSMATFDGIQYQSTRTIRVPDQIKPNYDEPSHFESPSNALCLHQETFENDITNKMNRNGDSYDYEYCESEINVDDAIDSYYDAQADQYGGQERPAKLNVVKPAKRVKLNNDPSEYNHVADIRRNGKHGETLYYNEHKFYKSNQPNTNGQQRWACAKRTNNQCRAAASTMQVDGVVMMQILVADHKH